MKPLIITTPTVSSLHSISPPPQYTPAIKLSPAIPPNSINKMIKQILIKAEVPNRELITSYTVAAYVTELASRYFTDRVYLENMSLPEGLVAIGANTFHSCRSLKFIDLPSTVTFIGEGAFILTAIRGITIQSGVTELAERTFGWCGELLKVTLPEGLTRIGLCAFRMCSKAIRLLPPISPHFDRIEYLLRLCGA